MTVAELRAALAGFPGDMEVLAYNAEYDAPDTIATVRERTVYDTAASQWFEPHRYGPGERPPVGRTAIVLGAP